MYYIKVKTKEEILAMDGVDFCYNDIRGEWVIDHDEWNSTLPGNLGGYLGKEVECYKKDVDGDYKLTIPGDWFIPGQIVESVRELC